MKDSRNFAFAWHERSIPTNLGGGTTVSFGIKPPLPDPPTVALCLVSIDAERNSENDVRIKADVISTRTDRFNISLGTWGSRILNTAGVSMMRIPASQLQLHFRCGFSKHVNEKQTIKFDKAFDKGINPMVFVALRSIDAQDNWRFKTEVSNITTSSFDLDVSTWGSGKLYTCEIQWIAFPDNLPNVEVGTFEASGCGYSTVKLSKQFNGIPSILTGITSFDIGSEAGLRLRVIANSSVSDPSLVYWKVDSWGDSLQYVYNVKGTFLAFWP